MEQSARILLGGYRTPSYILWWYCITLRWYCVLKKVLDRRIIIVFINLLLLLLSQLIAVVISTSKGLWSKLMSIIFSLSQLSNAEEQALDLITKTGSSLAILCLVACIFTFARVRFVVYLHFLQSCTQFFIISHNDTCRNVCIRKINLPWLSFSHLSTSISYFGFSKIIAP